MSLQCFYIQISEKNLPEVQLTSVPEFFRDLQLVFTTLNFICPKNFASSTVGLTVGGHLKIVGAGGFSLTFSVS